MTKAAVDLSEFEAASPTKLVCFFTRLDETQREKVTAAKEAGYSYPTISKVMATWGIKVGSSTIGRHYQGGCACATA